jgi:hypothetical protein
VYQATNSILRDRKFKQFIGNKLENSRKIAYMRKWEKGGAYILTPNWLESAWDAIHRIGDARPRCRLDNLTTKGLFDGMICKVNGTIR